MITVICTQCRAQLEMDDAFAGGVCRCQYCGTIQTVPPLSKLKQRQAAPTAAPVPASVTALPVGGVAPRPRNNGSGHGNGAPVSGLDALAEAVASSSGLDRSSLRTGAKPASEPSRAPAQTGPIPSVVEYARPVPAGSRRTTFLIVGLAALAGLLLLLTGVMFFTVRGFAVQTAATLTPSPSPAVPAAPSDQSDEDIVVPAGPHFCGVSLAGESSIVYVLDRGEATADLFDTLKEAAYRSIESLEPSQKFAVILWDKPEDKVAYPSDGTLAPASKAAVEAAQDQFKQVYASGRADPRGAVERAAALKPSAIVIVTGKAFDLDEDLVDATREALAGTQTKVHSFALKGDDDSKVLEDISKATKGQYKVVNRRELRRYSK